MGNVLASAALTAGTPVSPSPIFSGLSLTAGDYFLVINQDANVVGQVFWNGSLSPTITTDPNADPSSIFDFFASSTQPFPASSNFSVVTGEGLHFRVTGDQGSPVPEPSSLCLLLIGIGVPAIRRLRMIGQAA